MTDTPITLGTLALLPDVGRFRAVAQALALLDAILMPEWQFRYFSFNSKWAAGEMMASVRNGSGDDQFALFLEAGAIIKGFHCDSVLADAVAGTGRSVPWMFTGVPSEFSAFLSEPAFDIDHATFCIWRSRMQKKWSFGSIKPPNAEAMSEELPFLKFFIGVPAVYHSWAQEYYEREIPLEGVSAVLAHTPLTEELLTSLNSEMTLKQLTEDLEEIGYPLAE